MGVNVQKELNEAADQMAAAVKEIAKKDPATAAHLAEAHTQLAKAIQEIARAINSPWK
ncbi:Uncharacterised protein [Achromobacter xylosoxidans]|uniref:hypothetical protein n=1 Tax=Alcaligenes xylosoxydans xylosoxydans TaxID=85698 RepID=UPI0006C28DF6|nr:hypothetical protein [Achromobacter xylosoxidans]CUK13060.1 Uncharacterised protein [Achromobacter xylosoxidans]CUR81879.1 hypothetical protein BN2910_52080 [Achromobacter xylosoxidans]